MPAFDNAIFVYSLVLAIGYLLGSIPSGKLIADQLGLGDLRNIGSGNIGATNVLRTGHKGAAAATLIADAAKGALAVWFGCLIAGAEGAQLAGLAAFVGHCWTFWLDFKGGKGVATFLGVMLALEPSIGIAACLSWAAIAYALRISSLAALVAAALTPIWVILSGCLSLLVVSAILAGLVFWRHSENIARLRNRTEPRIGQS